MKSSTFGLSAALVLASVSFAAAQTTSPSATQKDTESGSAPSSATNAPQQLNPGATAPAVSPPPAGGPPAQRLGSETGTAPSSATNAPQQLNPGANTTGAASPPNTPPPAQRKDSETGSAPSGATNAPAPR